MGGKTERDPGKRKLTFKPVVPKDIIGRGTKEYFSSSILVKPLILKLQVLYKKGDPNFIMGSL